MFNAKQSWDCKERGGSWQRHIVLGRIDSGNRLLARREPRAEWRSPRPQQHVPSVLLVLARQDGVPAGIHGHREINGDFAPTFSDTGYLELVFISVLSLKVPFMRLKNTCLTERENTVLRYIIVPLKIFK